MSPPSERDERFVEHLEQLAAKQDRGALAALRRGLGKDPGEAPEMYPYVFPLDPPPDREKDYFLVASLFALWHQGKSVPAGGDLPANLGASLDRLAPLMTDKREAVNREAVERRFVALLNCHRDELPEHLRHAVGLLKSKDIPIEWAQLLQDIQWWGSDRRTVQRSWARAFWGQTPATAPGAAPTEAETPSPDDEGQ